jgi:hypothetical protein
MRPVEPDEANRSVRRFPAAKGEVVAGSRFSGRFGHHAPPPETRGVEPQGQPAEGRMIATEGEAVAGVRSESGSLKKPPGPNGRGTPSQPAR